MTADLSAALTHTRDLVQTFDQALGLLVDTDLHHWPGSPGAASPRVTGTPDRQPLYLGDAGLRHRIIRGLQQTHDCLMALAQLDCVDEPTAFDDAPAARALPTLARMHTHLATVDQALTDVQRHIHHLGPDDRTIAHDACAHITGHHGDTQLFLGRELPRKEWDTLARRARQQCATCWRHAGDTPLCTVHTGQEHQCRGVGDDRTCTRMIPSEHTRCGACRTYLSRQARAC